MKHLIKWLKSIQYLKQTFYEKAADHFKGDETLSKFLGELAEDEAYFSHFINSAATFLIEIKHDLPLDFSIDETVKKKIEAPLVEYTLLMDANRLKKHSVLEAVIEIETSDLNEILLYTIRMLTKFSVVFHYTAAKIQAHKRRIYLYFKSIPEELFFINSFKQRSERWRSKILIVEQNENVGIMIKEFLRKSVQIVTMRDEKGALEKLSSSYYDLIISNFELSGRNGIEFYKEITAVNSSIKDNFLFYAPAFYPLEQGFFSMHNIQFICKPLSLAKLERLVHSRFEYEGSLIRV